MRKGEYLQSLMENRYLLIGIAASGLYFLSVNFIGTVLARYSRDLGISVEGTSLIWSTLFITSLIARPITGYLADRIGSYFIMSIGCLLISLSAFIYSTSRYFAGIILGRILQGLGSAFFLAPSIAIVATVAGDRAGVALGIRAASVSLSRVIGPPIAGYVADVCDYRASFMVASVLALIVSVLCLYASRRYVRDEVMSSRSRWSEIANLKVILVTAANAMLGIFYMTLTCMLQIHYRDLGYSASTYGVFMMIFSITGGLAMVLVGRILQRCKPEIISSLGYVIAALSFIALAHTYRPPYSFLVGAVFGVGIGMSIPANQYMIVSSVPSDARNRATSIMSMGFDAGGFTGPILYSYVLTSTNYVTCYHLLSIPALIAALLVFLRKLS